MVLIKSFVFCMKPVLFFFKKVNCSSFFLAQSGIMDSLLGLFEMLLTAEGIQNSLIASPLLQETSLYGNFMDFQTTQTLTMGQAGHVAICACVPLYNHVCIPVQHHSNK